MRDGVLLALRVGRFGVSLALLWLVATRAQAHVERFALIVGNNVGSREEANLRYAESDALRLYDVLRELGDFSPANMTLLRGRDAASVREALLVMNDRIRQGLSAPDTQAVLVVYYSGHADQNSLHLGGSELALSELALLARGSAANFRLVVLDACRSGALTRVKGGRLAPPFALPDASYEPPPGDGLALLTASSTHEDAQESDELGAGFFTHALVSGLLGAADSDADGAVVLDEAYRYAYEVTLRATSRTLVGTQHPTFHYDLRGRGQLVLTRPRAHQRERASLSFPAGLGFLLMRGAADGPVVVELDGGAKSRTLSLEPGRYFVRARAKDVLYEGEIEAASGTSLGLDVKGMKRTDYARLLRKGSGKAHSVHALEAGARMRTALPNASSLCFGGFIGYQLDYSDFGLRTRASVCASSLENRVLRAEVIASDLELRIYRAWDIALSTFELGLGPGISLFHQRFETRGEAPTRLSLAPFLVLAAGAQWQLPQGLYAGLELAGETHFLRLREEAAARRRFEVSFAARSTLALGRHF